MSRFILCVYLAISMIIISAAEVNAQELDMDMFEINSYIADITDCEISFDTIVDYIRNGNITGLISRMKDIAINNLKFSIVYHKNLMFTIIAICLLSVIFKRTIFENHQNFYGQLLICSVAMILLQMYCEFYILAKNVINNLSGFMSVSMPVYFAISASLSDKLPLSVYGVFTAFVAFFHYGTTSFLLPAVTVSALFGISENINFHFDTSGIRKYINTTVNWLLGLYTTFFVAILKISHLGAYGTDKLVMSGIRYTLSHSIPVVGGFLSEIAGAVITSTLILHNAVGLGCVSVIVLIAAVPFFVMFAVSCILRLIASVFSGIAYRGLCNIIMLFGDCICELSVIMLCGCVTFIIGIGIQISFGR